jgi:hypothetical protein
MHRNTVRKLALTIAFGDTYALYLQGSITVTNVGTVHVQCSYIYTSRTGHLWDLRAELRMSARPSYPIQYFWTMFFLWQRPNIGNIIITQGYYHIPILYMLILHITLYILYIINCFLTGQRSGGRAVFSLTRKIQRPTHLKSNIHIFRIRAAIVSLAVTEFFALQNNYKFARPL